MDKIHLVECPRDAMQGWKHEITTEDKQGYLKTLFQVGFDTLDLGSFVSPKAVPQMADTGEILQLLEEEMILPSKQTRSLVIVANERGAQDASQYGVIDDMGFPLSLSESFQQRNTGASIEKAFSRLDAIQNICVNSNKRLVVYLSMGFGNPYGDPYHPEMLMGFSTKLKSLMDIKVIAISDTVGTADEQIVKDAFSGVVKELPDIEFGAHMHLNITEGLGKIEAAIDAGCRRFDGAIRGIGGCPMAQDDLVGNAPTEHLVQLFESKNLWAVPNPKAWSQAQSHALEIFSPS